MSDFEVITVDLAVPGRVGAATPCGALLAEGLPRLEAPPVEPDGAGAGEGSKPYTVDMVLNPKAWGSLPSNRRLRFEIPAANGAMQLALRREVEAAYSLGSWELIDQLAVGVFGLEQWTLHQGPPGRTTARGVRLVEQMRQAVSDDRRELFAAFATVRSELVEKERRCLELLESYAVCRAVREELPGCEQATLHEARRYLSLPATDDHAARRTLASKGIAGRQPLTGSEGRDLVRAAETLGGSLRSLRAAQGAFAESLPQRNVAEAALWLALLGPAGLPAAAAQATEAIDKVAGSDPRPQAAGQKLARASREWQDRFADLAIRYPILFKVGDVVDQGEDVLRTEVGLALQSSLEASAELTQILVSDPEEIWRFPGSIDRSLRHGFAAHGAFASRVAVDQLERANGMPLFARLNLGVQLITTTLMFVPAPPVKLATAIASVLGDAAEMLESYFDTKGQKLGFQAALDPALSLGPDHSYASTVTQAAFVALGILPLPAAVKEWAQDSAEAAKAAAVREAALEAVR